MKNAYQDAVSAVIRASLLDADAYQGAVATLARTSILL